MTFHLPQRKPIGTVAIWSVNGSPREVPIYGLSTGARLSLARIGEAGLTGADLLEMCIEVALQCVPDATREEIACMNEEQITYLIRCASGLPNEESK